MKSAQDSGVAGLLEKVNEAADLAGELLEDAPVSCLSNGRGKGFIPAEGEDSQRSMPQGRKGRALLMNRECHEKHSSPRRDDLARIKALLDRAAVNLAALRFTEEEVLRYLGVPAGQAEVKSA